LVVRLMLPLATPAVCGANRAVRVLLCPAAIVRGVATPLTLKPGPVELTCVIVRFALPVFVMATGNDLVCPSIKLPKLILAGETLIPAWTPVPVNARPGAAPGASLVIPTVPPVVPVAVGANFTCTWADWPAAKVAGVAMPVSL
jgi:hypothetical protein